MPALDRPVATTTGTNARQVAQQQVAEQLDQQPSAASLTVASLLRRYVPKFLVEHRPHVAAHVESTLARLGFCRTSALGGRTYDCRQCGEAVSVYNSCGDRHCPQCSGARRRDWLAKTAQLLVPGVTYFQVVFTLPDTLSPLILGSRRQLYRILLHAANESLQALIETRLGMQSAAVLVLHTWNQRLEHHPHVHALVPGCGPSLDGQRWIPCRLTRATRSQAAKPLLVDNVELGQVFQQRFLNKLNGLRRHAQLQLSGAVAHLQDESAWEAFTASLRQHDWCVFIERPPTAKSSPEHVLKYLARYLTGGPIADHRLVRCDHDVVTFQARSRDKTKQRNKKKQRIHQRPQVEVPLSGAEFTRRWTLHILPKGFTRTRCYGGYSNTNRQAYLKLCQALNPTQSSEASQTTAVSEQSAHTAEEDSEPEASAAESKDAEDQRPCCPRCQQRMTEVAFTYRPSWREVFYGPNHHSWFES